jgi:hypothetical protein
MSYRENKGFIRLTIEFSFIVRGSHRGRKWLVLQGVASDRKQGVMTMQDKVNSV